MNKDKYTNKIKASSISETITVLLFFTLIIITIYLMIMYTAGDKILQHQQYDSFTRQAVAWKNGKMNIAGGEGLSWLELAKYKGKYYVSFPPVPSLIILPLTYRFGLNTPDTLLSWIYAYISFIFAFLIFKNRIGKSSWMSVFYAFAFVFGCNILALSFKGWVWFQAQTLGFMFATASVYFIMSKKKYAHLLAYLFWALSIGCRPFHAIYAPYLLYQTYKNIFPPKTKLNKKMILTFLWILSPAILIITTLMIYNFVRFDNIFEFGHNYLTAFTDLGYKQFSFDNIGINFRKTLRLPRFAHGLLQFNSMEGNSFFLVNPIFIIVPIAMIKYRKSKEAWFIFSLIFINAFLFLCHKTLGGLQFGSRYFVDIIPWVLALLLIDRRVKERFYIELLAIFGIAINFYGLWWFWIYSFK